MNGGKGLVSNAIYLYILIAASYFLGLLVYPFLARVVSVEVFGLVGFAMAIALLLQVLVEYGFLISGTAQVSAARDDPRLVSRVVTSITQGRMALALVALVVFGVCYFAVDAIGERPLIFLLFILSSIIAALSPDFYFRGVERMRGIAVRAVASKLLSVLLIVLTVRADEDVLWVPGAFLIGNLFALSTSWLSVFRSGVLWSPSDARTVFALLRDSFGFFLSRLAVGLNQSVGPLVLGLRFGADSVPVAHLAASARIITALELSLIPVSDSLYPRMVRDKNYRLFFRVLIVGLLAWTAVCTLVLVFAEPIMTVVYGAPFAPGARVLQILVIGVYFSFAANMFGYTALAPLGLSRHANAAIICSAIFAASAYGVLFLVGAISLTSIAMVMSTSSLIVFVYRFSAYVLFRRGQTMQS